MTHLSNDQDWRTAAACLTEDPDLFFPTGTEGTALLQIEQAKAVCRRCPAVEQCLQFALAEGASAGVFGGLTERERASIDRSLKRGKATAEDAALKAARARQPQQERTLHTIFDENTVRLFNGHLGWTGSQLIYLNGRKYTPKQVAFIAARGRAPEGPVLSDCGSTDCLLPAHLTDRAERGYCGTRAGYQRHVDNGEDACGPCRKAHLEVGNRLRRRNKTAA